MILPQKNTQECTLDYAGVKKQIVEKSNFIIFFLLSFFIVAAPFIQFVCKMARAVGLASCDSVKFQLSAILRQQKVVVQTCCIAY